MSLLRVMSTGYGISCVGGAKMYYNFRSDAYMAISYGRGKTIRHLVAEKKNGIATTYTSWDPKWCIFEIETTKIASTKHASDATSGFSDALSNYQEWHEALCLLAPLLFEKSYKIVPKIVIKLIFRFAPLYFSEVSHFYKLYVLPSVFLLRHFST